MQESDWGRLGESLVERASGGIRYAEKSLNSLEYHAFLCLKDRVYDCGVEGAMKDSRAFFLPSMHLNLMF